MMKKYKYYIKDIEKTKSEVIDWLAVHVTADTHAISDFISMDIANYDEAEKWLKRAKNEMYRCGMKRYILISSAGSLRITREEVKGV